MEIPSEHVSGVELVGVIADPDTRAVLETLSETETVTVEGLAAELAENGRRKRVRITLHHVHLPKLAAAGLIDFDAETGELDVTDALPGVAASLDRLAENPEMVEWTELGPRDPE